MFKRLRETAPSAAASDLGRVLEPLPVLPWGPLALSYLGVPIVVGVRSACFCFSLTILVLDKYGGSLTPADREPYRFTTLSFETRIIRQQFGN